MGRAGLNVAFFKKPCAPGSGFAVETMYNWILENKFRKYLLLKIPLYKSLGFGTTRYISNLISKLKISRLHFLIVEYMEILKTMYNLCFEIKMKLYTI